MRQRPGWNNRYGRNRGYRGRSRGRGYRGNTRSRRSRGYRGTRNRGTRGRGRGSYQRKQKNWYDKTRNDENRSGRGGNTSEYSKRGTKSTKGRGRGKASNRGSRGRGRGKLSTTSTTPRTDYRNLPYHELVREIINKPDNHYHIGECNECGMKGHWKYACSLMDPRSKNRVKQKAENSSSAYAATTTSSTTTEEKDSSGINITTKHA